MKTGIAILIFFASFFVIKEEYSFSNHFGQFIIGLDINPCPVNHEKAEKELKKYLSREITIENLNKNYDITVDSSTPNKIYSLEQKIDEAECKKLIEKLNLSEDDRLHSFYKVEEHYFIVNYFITKTGEFDYGSITMVNSEFEAVAVIIDIGTSQK